MDKVALLAATGRRPTARDIQALLRTPQARQAGRTVARAVGNFYRSRAKRDKYVAKRRNAGVGEKPGTGLNKTNQFRTDGLAVYNGNGLNKFELLEIPRQDNTFSLNTRMRDMIYLTGFKVCFTIRNIVPSGSKSLYVNIALVSAKNRGSLGDGTDFFRSYQGASRQQDFADATLNAMDRHCLPLNTDEHTVHFHERRILMQDASASIGNKKEANTWTYDTWVPINRQIRFEGAAALPETKFQLCHWVGRVGDTIAASNTTFADAYSIDCKVVTFFKEPMPVLQFR